MNPTFWHQRWRSNEIAFHESEPNALLRACWSRFEPGHPQRVFVPLCGKTKDIDWLLAQDMHVCGVELSEQAVQALFARLDRQPDIVPCAQGLKRYASEHLTVYVGDFFDLTPAQVGDVDLIYDRAALVALPAELRRRYAVYLQAITATAPMLAICLDYDQGALTAPPFAVDHAKLCRLYHQHYQIESLASRLVDLKGVSATENRLATASAVARLGRSAKALAAMGACLLWPTGFRRTQHAFFS